MFVGRWVVQEVGVALDASDRARLRGIESGLTQDDPVLVKKFRSWRPPSGPRPLLPGWSVAPRWMLLVFLVAACTWIVSPVLGALVIVVCGIGRLRARSARADAQRGTEQVGRVLRWPDTRG